MNQEIQIFKSEEFGTIRTLDTTDNTLFCLPDVCNALDLIPSKVAQRLEDDVLSKYPITDSLGRTQQANFVNEDGLYDVILDSRKPEAKKFRKWITSEVLPSIRKTGGYMTAIDNETPEQTMARAIIIAQATMKRQQEQIEQQRQLLNDQRHAIEQKDYTISDQKKQIEESRPAVTFTNAVSGSQSACLIGELAKLICQNGVQIGQNRLFEWLRKNHYLGSVGERRNIPNQEYIEQDLFIVKKGVRTGNDGVLYTTKTTKVTGKGQVYFINKFLNKDKNKENELQNNNA